MEINKKILKMREEGKKLKKKGEKNAHSVLENLN